MCPLEINFCQRWLATPYSVPLGKRHTASNHEKNHQVDVMPDPHYNLLRITARIVPS